LLSGTGASVKPPGLHLRCLSGLRCVLRLALVALVALWSVLLLLWLTLHWGILPHIAQWRGQMETRASAALGVAVRIGDIQVRSSGWVPSVELSQVVLLDTQSRPALVLPRVVAALSPKSLLAWDLRFTQLHIEGAQLEVRRDARGRIFVAGFDLDANASDPADEGAAVRWFLKQPEVVIRGGSLRWTDEQRQAPPLALADVQLVLRNGLNRHAVQLDATPPPAWGERFSLRGRFTQPLIKGDDFNRWSGTVHADLPRADVHELQRYVSLPFAMTEGDGALRAWVDVRQGTPVAATVDLALRAVNLQLARGLQPLALAQVQGRLVASRDGDSTRLEARQFSFHTGDGLQWPKGDLHAVWRQRGDGPVLGGEFGAAGRIDIGVVARVAAALPLGEPVRKLLAETRPEGQVHELSLRFDGPLDAPTGYQAAGRIDALSLAARAQPQDQGIGRPGIDRAQLSFKATERGGEAQLQLSPGGVLHFPGVFDDPAIGFDELVAGLQWRVEPAAQPGRPAKWSLQVKDVRFANADAQGSLSARWSTGAGSGEGEARGHGARFPGLLDLEGQLSRGVALRTARYLPRGIAFEARDYVARAVLGGNIGRTSFKVKGDLADFPFGSAARGARKGESEGEFRIAGKVSDVTLAYLPGQPAHAGLAAQPSAWPSFTRVAGELVFDKASMEIRNAQAQLGNLRLSQVQGGIARLGEQARLVIDGQVNGPATDMLRFVAATPVGGWLGQSLAQATATGQAELKLGLDLPLADGAAGKVKGSIAFHGNDLRIQPDTPLLAQARGRVDFSEHGFQVVGASARLLGGEASFEGSSQPDGSLRFTGQGTASAEGLRRAVELGPVARLAGALSGQTPYRVALGVVRGHTELLVTSNLVGMAAELPAPLRKPAEASLPLRYQVALLPDAAGQPPRDQLKLELGTVLQAVYQRELPREGSHEPARVLRGSVGINERPPLPSSGVAAAVNLPLLDVDAWQATAARLAGAAATAGGGHDDPSLGGYAPQKITLRAQQFQYGERSLNRLVAGLSEEGGKWRANLEAEQLAGYAEYRPARRGAGAQAAGQVYARLARLSLPKREADQVVNLLEQQPASVPALDIVVDDLELRGKRLGRVEIEAVNRNEGAGEAREWRLNRLNLTTPEARLTATGSWQASGTPGGRRRSVMNFKLDLADSGAFLERLGAGRAVRGGKGLMTGQIAWTGSPLALDYNSLSGQFNVAIESGQFLKAEPGAARLLGVLSLQALPRRLSLDFRDVFQQGFAFDSIHGDVSIAEGVARTNNLRMRGVQAAVLMEGQADVEHETQDLRVIVVPEINAGTASLAYAAINPAVGLGTFLAQLVLRKPLIQAGTREFHISGPWGDPKVDRVERKFSDPLPVIEDPPPAGGASAAGATTGNAAGAGVAVPPPAAPALAGEAAQR
jgi:uncharacterized protein (TIGR02099 family)